MANGSSSKKGGVAPIIGVVLALVAVASIVIGKFPDAVPGLGSAGKKLDGELRIVAATELDVLRPALEEAQKDLGFTIHVESPHGTVENTNHLIEGDFKQRFDAAWFATNRYVEAFGGEGQLGESTSIATSPVVLGVRGAKARGLGWTLRQPTWQEIYSAVTAGKLDFGMTDPATSNSGFTAVASVASAVGADGGEITADAISKSTPKLQRFFSHQSVSSGSSGWLAENFKTNPQSADALFNYESVLHDLRREGTDIEIVVPSDGTISADYPLTVLKETPNENASEKVEALAKWFEKNPDALTEKFLRPAQGDQQDLPFELDKHSSKELPFPKDGKTITALQDAYYNKLRKGGSTAFVLDVSGSMEGKRMQLLKQTMNELITSTDPGIAFRDGEQISVVPFARETQKKTTVTFERGEHSQSELSSAVGALKPGGTTALYSALADAYDDVTADGSTIPSIVVMSDGETNRGMDFEAFKTFHSQLPEEKRRIPVFVIMYGEADVVELRELVAMTNGAEFNALNGDLNLAFKQIRGYQ